MARCLCGRETPFKKCCGPVLAGKRHAATPEDLVRARYCAFVKQDMDFLLRSHHPRTACRFDRDSSRAWAESNTWLGLEIVGSRAASDDDGAKVEFIATYQQGGMRFRHHEISDLRRIDGVWHFYDGAPAGESLA